MVWRSSIQALGYAPANGPWVLVYPVATVVVIAAAQWAMASSKHIEFAYFSPFVAASAAISSRICLRSGLLAALLSSAVFLFVLPRPHDALLPNVSEIVAIASAIGVVFFTAPRISDTPPDASAPMNSKDPLPFMRPRKPGNGDGADRKASCWAVSATGRWSDDDWYGRQMGKIWKDRLATRHGDCPPLSMILKDMVHAGRWTGVEAGFCHSAESSIRERSAPSMRVSSLAKDQADNLRL